MISSTRLFPRAKKCSCVGCWRNSDTLTYQTTKQSTLFHTEVHSYHVTHVSKLDITYYGQEVFSHVNKPVIVTN